MSKASQKQKEEQMQSLVSPSDVEASISSIPKDWHYSKEETKALIENANEKKQQFNQAELPGMPPKPEITINMKINIQKLVDKKGNEKLVATPEGMGHPYEILIETTKLNRIFNNLIKKGYKIEYYG